MQGTSRVEIANSNLVVLALAGATGIISAGSLDLSSGGAVLTGFGAALAVMLVLGWASHRALS